MTTTIKTYVFANGKLGSTKSVQREDLPTSPTILQANLYYPVSVLIKLRYFYFAFMGIRENVHFLIRFITTHSLVILLEVS